MHSGMGRYKNVLNIYAFDMSPSFLPTLSSFCSSAVIFSSFSSSFKSLIQSYLMDRLVDDKNFIDEGFKALGLNDTEVEKKVFALFLLDKSHQIFR